MSDDVSIRRERVDQALDVVRTWDEEDRRFFANWMTGYNPDAVMEFERSSRRLPVVGPQETGGAPQ